jgi:hypothetical protein
MQTKPTPKKSPSKPKPVTLTADALRAKCSERALAHVRKARGYKTLTDEDIKLVARIATLAYQKLKGLSKKG